MIVLAVKNDDLRYCHSDIRLHMSVVTFLQLYELLGYAFKFTRCIEGENSFQHKTACHWIKQLDDVYIEFEKTFNGDNYLSTVLRTYFD